ncbi:hypothetical protein GE061_011150 [Apolygus lucorum]|uniref:glutaminase n=1 Tax=Apolygus lucorum TaxID=248454 RepID=A0A8S9XYN7_APOLU|nr:hypothetical protein GE061_011150 [Apolygus lucorum]
MHHLRYVKINYESGIARIKRGFLRDRSVKKIGVSERAHPLAKKTPARLVFSREMWGTGRLTLIRPQARRLKGLSDRLKRPGGLKYLRIRGKHSEIRPRLPNLQTSSDEIQEFHRKALTGAAISTRATETEHTKSTEDMLFEMFTVDDAELTSVGKFLAALRQTGLRKNDPRLAGLMDSLRKLHEESGREGGSPETQKLTREQFKRAISTNLVLISRAFRHHFIIPDFADFTKYIEEFYWKCKSKSEGKVADYIPQLARANPDNWGEVVHQYVGQEPSGRNFNELVLDHNKKPHNPMINAGAIIICSLLKTLVHPEMTLAEKFDFTMTYFKKMAGGEYLGFNNAVFLSEREAADRNYALGFYMREHKCYPDKTNLKEVMDFYFQVRLSDPLLLVGVFHVMLQQLHNFSLELFWGGFVAYGPIVDVPIIGWYVQEEIILIQQRFIHGVEMFSSKS